MNNVYLCQFPVEFGNRPPFYAHVPLATGMIWSYAQTSDIVRKNYQLKDMIFLRDNMKNLLDSLEDPKVFGLSCYHWNVNYSLKLAEMIKSRWPDCTIVAGGPSVPIRDDKFFIKHHYVDIVSYHEGEKSFQGILLALLGEKNLNEVPGIAYHQNGKIIRTEKSTRIVDLDEIPSPYQLGLFDHMPGICKEKGIILNSLIETNRGCPFACTFCDWGSGSLGKVKKFEMRRVKKELLWVAKNQLEYVLNCDANFGMYKDRDLEITKWLIRLKKRYGYPQIFDTNWSKNNNDTTVKLAKMMMDAGLLRRFTHSIQSGNEESLKAIKRKNIKDSDVQNIVTFAKTLGITTQTQIMLPLPLETKKSFQENFIKFFEQDLLPSTGPVIILPNSEMDQPEYREKYGFQTVINQKFINYSSDTVIEEEELLVGTNTMTQEEFRHCLLWGWMINEFHMQGHTNVIADFAKQKNIGLLEFYDAFVDLATEDTESIPNRLIKEYRDHVKNNITHKISFGAVNNFLHDALIDTHRDEYHSNLKTITEKILGIDNELIIEDLIKLQDYNKYNPRRELIEVFDTHTNLWDHIYNNKPLIFESQRYLMTHPGADLFHCSSIGDWIVKNRFDQIGKTKISMYDPFFHEG